MGIWRVTGSTRLKNLTVGGIVVFSSPSVGNKLVGVHDRMGKKFASKFSAHWLSSPMYVPLACSQLMELFNAGSCVAPVWGAMPAADLKVVLRQPITTPYVHVNQTCSSRAFAKSLMIIHPATLWSSFFMLEMI
eukprot:1160528-Pelagomonas_calceolata.AAC.1